MSWSVSAVGKPKAVAVAIEAQLSSPHCVCAEPEETVRQAARAAIAVTLAAQAPNSVVEVQASGSMSSTYNADTKTWGQPCTNSLTITVKPLLGFVE